MSAFVNVLLMTRRRRSEPVSGANVKPDFLTSETASASATENASARSDGSEIETAVRELRREAGDERLDLRVVGGGEREEADFLQPASSMNLFVAFATAAGSSSRTGRYQ